jgi:hypothetical protein
MEVCPLARGVILSNDATPIHLITRWPSLLPSSFTRTPIGSSYDLLSIQEKYGLTTFHDFDLMG